MELAALIGWFALAMFLAVSIYLIVTVGTAIAFTGRPEAIAMGMNFLCLKKRFLGVRLQISPTFIFGTSSVTFRKDAFGQDVLSKLHPLILVSLHLAAPAAWLAIALLILDEDAKRMFIDIYVSLFGLVVTSIDQSHAMMSEAVSIFDAASFGEKLARILVAQAAINLLPLSILSGGRAILAFFDFLTGKRTVTQSRGLLDTVSIAIFLILFCYLLFHIGWALYDYGAA